MRIIHTTGDIFKSGAQVLVNPVNCRGVMGKGLALAFKQRYPDIMPFYEHACREKRLRIGKVQLLMRKRAPWILNFPTKDDWRNPSRLEYIQQGMLDVVRHIRARGIQSIAFPPLGCGNGNLEWEDVYPVMMNSLYELNDEIAVYLYHPTPGQPGAGFTIPERDRLIQHVHAYARTIAVQATPGHPYRPFLLAADMLLDEDDPTTIVEEEGEEWAYTQAQLQPILPELRRLAEYRRAGWIVWIDD